VDRQQALDLIGGLPAAAVRDVWDAAIDLPGTELRRGLWLGRNASMARPLKWAARRLIKRDYFGKLVFDDFGVNVRVSQDGAHAALPAADGQGGCKVDLPFALTDHGLDYGFHYLGMDSNSIQMRDVLRIIDLRTLSEVVPAEHLERIGAEAGQPGDGEMVIGYIVPLGIDRLRGTPFGMVWQREATAADEACARAWIAKRRFLDSSVVG
jgi:hypothetical protein